MCRVLTPDRRERTPACIRQQYLETHNPQFPEIKAFMYTAYGEGRACEWVSIDEGVWMDRHWLVQVMNCEKVAIPFCHCNSVQDSICLYQLYGPVNTKQSESSIGCFPSCLIPYLICK